MREYVSEILSRSTCRQLNVLTHYYEWNNNNDSYMNDDGIAFIRIYYSKDITHFAFDFLMHWTINN